LSRLKRISKAGRGFKIYTAYVCTNLVENMWDVLQRGVIGDAPVAIDDEGEHSNAFYQIEIALP
jgi:hypothetical protein